MTISPQFGGKVRKKDLEKFRLSKNWNGQKFENLIETTMDMSVGKIPGMLIDNYKNRDKKSPEKNIDIIPFDEKKFDSSNASPKFIWYGHSACLLQLNGLNFLIDPMLGPNASPIAPFATNRFSKDSLEVIDKLPKIDVALLTHDHYDHLDYESILKLKSKIDVWYVALGVSRHLESWGISSSQIVEFDWWDDVEFRDVKITFTPSRHFSGRGAFDRAKSLWGGWVFKSDDFSVYWSGDGGYGPHFKEVGNKLGPFDWGFMECGQYNKNWHAIHMYPEESIQAAIDSRVQITTPVHWGGFSLAMHSWKDPIKRFYNEAKKKKQNILTPRIGEVINMLNPPKQESWWIDLK